MEAVETAAPEILHRVVSGLDDQTQRDAVKAAIRAVPQDVQKDVLTSVLGNPTPGTQQRLWYVVVGTMSAAIFVFGSFAMVLLLMNRGAEAPLALATAALGGIVGLVATSPTQKG